MSDTWFNLRILWWHFQIRKGRLFRMQVYFNRFHWFKRGIKHPLSVYSFSPVTGWRERHSVEWDAGCTITTCVKADHEPLN